MTLRILFFLIVAVFMTGSAPCAVAVDAGRAQYYEVRVYSTQSAEQQQRVIDYWHSAAVPAYNRAGIQSIGVFTELSDSATNHIYVFIPYESSEEFAAVPAKLATDTVYQQAAAEFLNAPKSDPAYVRFESSLLVAFDGMPQMCLPGTNPPATVFELRTYMSSSEGKGLNKIRMFESGEIPVMKEAGLAPIFYGRAIAGVNMPCLMYMTCGENLDAHKQHWKAFSAAPVWVQLKADPQYQDNVSKIISILLKRTAASEI